MAMKPECAQAVNQAAGRTLSDAELDGIDGQIRDAMRRLAVQDGRMAGKAAGPARAGSRGTGAAGAGADRRASSPTPSARS